MSGAVARETCLCLVTIASRDPPKTIPPLLVTDFVKVKGYALRIKIAVCSPAKNPNNAGKGLSLKRYFIPLPLFGKVNGTFSDLERVLVFFLLVDDSPSLKLHFLCAVLSARPEGDFAI